MAKLKWCVSGSFFALSVLMLLAGQISLLVIYVISLILHELAHYVVAKIFKIKYASIKLMAFGSSLNFDDNITSNFKQFAIALAGPLTNFVICIICRYAFSNFFTSTLLQNIFIANCVIALTNLIPIYPLDGGRIFVNIFSCIFSRNKLIKFSNFLAIITSAVLFVLFFVSIFVKVNFTFGLFAIFLMNQYFESKKSGFLLSSPINFSNKNIMGIREYAVNSETKIFELFKLLKNSTICKFCILNDKGDKVATIYQNELIKILNKVDSTCTLKNAIKQL